MDWGLRGWGRLKEVFPLAVGNFGRLALPSGCVPDDPRDQTPHRLLSPGKMPRESLALSAEVSESPQNTAASPGHRTRGPGALPPSSCLDPGEGRSGGGEKKNWKGGRILYLEGEPVSKWTASVSRRTRPSEAGRGLCPNRLAPPARLPHLPAVRGRRQPFPDPVDVDVVHKERNFTRLSALFLRPRPPPACLSLQRGPGVRWLRGSRAASETSCAVSAGARGREADVARRLGARGGQRHLLTSASHRGSEILDFWPGTGGVLGAGPAGG